MNKDLQVMHLKQLVNDKECYEQFQQHIDDLISMRQRALETANEHTVVYRQQGAIDVLRKLKLLRETVNGT
jgi:protein-arginine kinase activator protein McsA